MLDLLFNRKISTCLTQILPLAYALTYCVYTYMLYGLDRVQHSPPSHTPILVTVKLIPTSGLMLYPFTVLNTDQLGTESSQAVHASTGHGVGQFHAQDMNITNAHTLADSLSGAGQYPTILWYDTVDNQR